MLESIVVQATDDCEIVVLDGASTDDTERVVLECQRGCDKLRYIRQETNGGVDRDIDRVVQLAKGEYCWLVPDDDLMKLGAIASVLEALRGGYSLVVVNVEVKDLSMSTVLVPNFLKIGADRVYHPSDMDSLFEKCGWELGYLGCLVIRRAIWLQRETSRYYGSYFVHIGVVFQKPLPGPALMMAKPVISVRSGNQSWLTWAFEIAMIKWPSLAWSFPLSERVKRKACSARRWNRLAYLILARARGKYSLIVYRQSFRPRLWSYWQRLIHTIIALLPPMIAKVVSYVLFPSFTRVLGNKIGATKGARKNKFQIEG